VYYDRTIGTRVTHCSYILTDYLEKYDENIYVVLTTEELREWEQNQTEDQTTMLIHSETSYDPPYLVLPAISDVSEKMTATNSVNLKTDWYYIYYNKPSATFRESKTLNTTFETGGMSYVQTMKGQFRSLEVTITQDGASKTWWLTRGLGIIKFEYDISSIEQTALLTDTDLLALYRPEAGKKAAISAGTPQAPATYSLPGKADDAARETMRILRTMAP
jgi:hypothetical protein